MLEIRYPDLPILARREAILAALREHQVIVVAGETGSGKTTQLPKLCLELGRGTHRMIGHTQPRRIAARAVAERLAEELGVAVGTEVGYAVRFTDRVGAATRVKVMTDGILLAEIRGDPMLRRYDTIIIDEAHERSLTIDFLLGYLARLLPNRPDLTLLITSATIDPQRFADHFGGAPVIEVSGRSYPVEIRYRPLDDDSAGPGEPRDQVEAIAAAVDELRAEGPGDVLVFLSGEREIRDTADALTRAAPEAEILPLYARLSAADQHRVFAPHDRRRIVLATNIAETSLTVPGIHYVVDPGTARISRYSNRTKVQRLPIEPISRASARQRAGRCGRIADGICIRLYSQADFDARPEFTEPEIQRTSLASVILQMAALRLGDVADFGFLDPPDRRQVADGVAVLVELGALEARPAAGHRLTAIGHRLARLPVDPRIGRMVLAADQEGCLREALVIAAALSIQDPREPPVDRQEAADAAHRRFADDGSDFTAWLNLWTHLREHQRTLSGSAFRRMCRDEFLHYLRVREWQDLHTQLRQVTRDLGLAANREPATRDRIHAAVLTGLLSHVGVRDAATGEYRGARGTRFSLSPASGLSRARPDWVVAAELVETTRLWAHCAARVDPEMVERAAAHLLKRTYSEPHWDADRGAAMAIERVSLYGLPLVAGRRVGFARVDPAASRELFIRHALVEGDWRTHHRFFRENRRRIADVEALEDRARRRDILTGDDALMAFYDSRIPAEVVSARHFDRWWKSARRDQPQLLDLPFDVLVAPDAGQVDPGDFPDALASAGLSLPLRYAFQPGDPDDGLTVPVPVDALPRIDRHAAGWQVPGRRLELVTALIRSLPKHLRRQFVPAPDHARAVLDRLGDPGQEALPAALARALRQQSGADVGPADFDLDRLPAHLLPTYEVVGGGGEVLGRGKDLTELRLRLAPEIQAALSRAAGGLERSGLRGWDGDALPRTFAAPGADVIGYPALVDEGESVGIRVLPSPAAQRRAMRAGTRRLLLLTLPSPARAASSGLDDAAKLVLSCNPHGSVRALLADCVGAALDALVDEHGGPAWDRAGFTSLRAAVGAGLPTVTASALHHTERALAASQDVVGRLGSLTSEMLQPSVADASAQVAALLPAGFVTRWGTRRLPDLVRYLRALERRLDRLPERPGRDRDLMAVVHVIERERADLLARLPDERRDAPDVEELRWMVQELRVSLLAPGQRTAYPVSEQRVRRAMVAIEHSA